MTSDCVAATSNGMKILFKKTIALAIISLLGNFFLFAQAAGCRLTGAQWSKQTVALTQEITLVVTGSDCAQQDITASVYGKYSLGRFKIRDYVMTFDNNFNAQSVKTVSFSEPDIVGRNGDVTIFFEAVTQDGGSRITSPSIMLKRITPANPGNPIPNQPTNPNPGLDLSFPDPLKSQTVMELLNGILSFALQIGIPIAVVMIIYAGVLFLTVGANPSAVGKAKTILLYAVIGLIIILVGKGFLTLIRSILDLANG